MKVKRYVLFTFDQYYPGGGWNDMIDSFDEINEFKDLFEAGTYNGTANYYQIVDLDWGKVVLWGDVPRKQ